MNSRPQFPTGGFFNGVGLNQGTEPCSRHAFYLDGCTVQFLPANPEAEYRLRIAQLISAFDIG